MPLRVLHLVGSPVDAFHADLSRLYAADCLTAIADPARYATHIAYVAPDGRWRFPESLDAQALADAPSLPLAAAIERLRQLRLDVMVPQMFCRPGMTDYRALFDLIGVPYLGNPPAAMALTATKARAKAVVAAAGVSVPAGELLREGDVPTLTPPVVVKPASADNSAGVTLVTDPDDYAAALGDAFAHDDEVLVEAYVPPGREVRCAVLERGGELVPLPLEEYRVSDIRRPADKLARGDDGDLRLVAKDTPDAWIVDPDDPVTERVQAAAIRCHVALGCRHYGLFDFRIDAAGEPWFLEAGLYCSFARKSVISVMAQAAGIAVDELFQMVLDECLQPQRR
ncbi:Vancomycin B-type resistance protein VanB [Paraconexibacter sp. AEG42_29]|uniref:Vancomycin B-type resistance protein VanB n=1 Tax=Paraconexibacter sp. AEG42_29 TaxID=2997339 RepID=A0AAU7B1V2_9ACTN